MKKATKFVSMLLAAVMTFSVVLILPGTPSEVIVAEAAGTVATATAPATPDPFAVTDVEIVNDRTAIIHFNNEVHSHFEMLSLARPNYLTYFMRVDGVWLQNDKEMLVGVGSRMYVRDDRRSVELVLGSATPDPSLPCPAGDLRFLPGGGTIEFNFLDDGRLFIPFYYFHAPYGEQMMQSGDVWIRDIHDQSLSTDVLIVEYPAFAHGALPEAPFLGVEEIRVLDNRSVYVRFNQRLTLTPNNAGQVMTGHANLLNGPFAAGTNAVGVLADIYTLVAPGDLPALRLAHSFHVPYGHPERHHALADGGREFILTFDGEILPATEYIFADSWNNEHLRGLINAAGQHYADTLAQASDPAVRNSGGDIAFTTAASIPESDFNLLGAELVEFMSGRFELVLTFDRPIAFTQVAYESRFRTRNAPDGMPWAAKFHDLLEAPVVENTTPGTVGFGVAVNDRPENRAAYFQSLHETGTGMTGTVLSVDDVRLILDLDGINVTSPAGVPQGMSGVPLLDAFRGDVIIGYFRNNHTIVIHNQNRFDVTLDADATVSVLPGALVGFGSRNLWWDVNEEGVGLLPGDPFADPPLLAQTGLPGTSPGFPAPGQPLFQELAFDAPLPDRVGQLRFPATNGARNTAIEGVEITANPDIVPWGANFNPDWDYGVVVTPIYTRFNHHDVYYFQFDGEKDPLIGGFSGDVRHSVNIQARVFAPDGSQFPSRPAETADGVNEVSGAFGAMELDYVVQARIPAYQIENKWIRAVIVPGNTARFLEFEFKPTGHDAHYTNPQATSYNITNHGTAFPPTAIGGGTFTLGWLLVWGGTFPVFDGCEHGQVWTTPWEYEIITAPDARMPGQPAGTVMIRHTLTNDQNLMTTAGGVGAGGFVPSSSNVAIGGDFTPFGTGLEYTVDYIIRPDCPVVDMAITVFNPSQVARTYEFYVCNTWSPGEISEWGHGSMKHIDNVQLVMQQTTGWLDQIAVNLNHGETSNDRSNSDVLIYSLFNYERSLPVEQYLPQWIRDRMIANPNVSYNADGIQTNNLPFFNENAGYSNVTGSINRNLFFDWYTMRYIPGITNSTFFASDLNRRPQADWYGAVNLRNLEGVMRAGPNINQYTPAIKYWIWNYRQMFDNLPFERQSGNAGRPYLEPWAGTGDQYFSNRAIGPGETHHWVESYYHTFGLDMATNANERGAVFIKFYDDGPDGFARPVVEIYDTFLLQEMTARMTVTASDGVTMSDIPAQTWTYTSRITAHEVFESEHLVPIDGAIVLVEIFQGAEATGDPAITAWAVSGRPFVRIGSTPGWATENWEPGFRTEPGEFLLERPDAWTDRESPVTSVHISHSGLGSPFASEETIAAGLGSIDIPGRVEPTGAQQFTLREVFAYAEPFSADGNGVLVWTKHGPHADEVSITSGVNSPGHTINSQEDRPAGTINATGSTWWHTHDFITLRGHEPGSRVVLRATSRDDNIVRLGLPSVYEEIAVYVRKPLYLSIPYNPGNPAGTTPGYYLPRYMFSPYRFNMDMNIPLTISHHELDEVEGPIRVEIWDRNNRDTEPYIAFNNLQIGENLLFVPAYTFSREEYYRIVARSADGTAFGYEFFRVDGYSDIDWNRTVFVDGDDVIVRFEKKNSGVVDSLLLAPSATAFVNDQEFPVTVGTNSIADPEGGRDIWALGLIADTNTLIIQGGATALGPVGSHNFVEVIGLRLPDYPQYDSFSIMDNFLRRAE